MSLQGLFNLFAGQGNKTKLGLQSRPNVFKAKSDIKEDRA